MNKIVMWAKKSLIVALLVIVLVLPLISAADVAYIYNKDIRIDQNIINEFNSSGLSVNTIQENKISTTDFSKYKIVFVGDELFDNPSKIPIGQRPTIISNYYHGAVFGLTDNDGISQLANNKPLNVNKNSQIIQVYTDAFYQSGSSLAIPYYYLADENKASGFVKTAGTYTGSAGLDIGDVISYASAGTQLVNGKTLNSKVCFYGLETIKNGKRSSDYWTPAAKQMFEECVAFTGSQCSNDNDCNDSDAYTKDTCLNPGQINSQCTYQNITCFNDNECTDGNERTVDQCVNPGQTSSYCRNTEVNCLYDLDCGATGYIEENFCFSDDVYRNFQNASCINAGTLQSHCDIDVSPKLIEQCSDTCSNGACVDIVCYNNNDCNDSDAYTKDTCLNPGQINSQCTYQDIACITDNDCNDSDVYTKDTCKNPNTPQSYCEYEDIECITDNDCNDNNHLTTDICLNPGTISSQCDHNPVECVYDSDCNDNNSSTSDSCLNNICHNDPIECFTNADCGTDSQSSLFCSSNNVVQTTTNYTCLNAGTKNSQCTHNTETSTIEQCSDICSNGACVDINCNTDSDCSDDDERTDDKCVNPGTTASFCRNTEVNCLNDLDCGATGYIEENFCFSDDVYKKYQNATCIDPATLDSYCVISVTPIKTQECEDANENTYDYCYQPQNQSAICNHDFVQCDNNNDCGTTQLLNNFCKGDDLWANYSVPLCNNPGLPNSQCSSENEQNFVEECSFGCSNGQCNEAECTYDYECGIIHGNEFCVGDDLHTITITPVCTVGSCDENTNEVVETCEFGCSQGACLEGGHDVGFIDFTNSFNKIFLEYNNGTDILDEMPVISCNETIKAKVEAKNFGDFYENVTLNGNAGGIVFSLSDINNMIPGGTNFRTSLSPYINLNLPSGFYNITVEAIIPIDDNPSNNQAIRTIEIQCETPECTQNNDCGSITSIITCNGNNVVNVTNAPQCITGECSENIINNILEVCQFGCYQGECIPGECEVDSDCPSDTETEQCLGNDLNVTSVDYFCNQGTCQQETESNIEECTFGCSENQCIPGECNDNADCGSEEVDNFCVGDDLHTVTTTPICTQELTCDETTNEQIIICEFGCSNGQCNPYTPNCGNNILDSGEQCDDGNINDGDGCSSQCLVETCEDVCKEKPFDFDVQIDRSLSTLMPFGYLGYVDPIQIWLITGPSKILVEKLSADVFVHSALESNQKNKIGITAFSSKVVNIRDLSNNEENLKEGIWSINVFGNTNYYDSIVYGVDKLNSQGRKNTQKIIIFVSDGKPSGIDGASKAIEAAKYARDHNVKIYTIGIDGILHVNAPLLVDMARISGGRYYFANTPAALKDIYKRLGEETCSEICSV